MGKKSASADQTSKEIGIGNEKPDWRFFFAKALFIQIIIQLSYLEISCILVIQVHIFINSHHPVSNWKISAERRRKAEVYLKDCNHVEPLRSKCTLTTPWVYSGVQWKDSMWLGIGLLWEPTLIFHDFWDTHSLLRASSSRHDRIRFVNGESRDEGVINSAKTGTILSIMCSCEPNLVNMICEFYVTHPIY